MRFPSLFAPSLLSLAIAPLIASQQLPISKNGNRTISVELFNELEELARVVDISYCVGMTGIHKPFSCASRCKEFPDFELITTWSTGPLLSDSCGYIAISQAPPRIILAFRGTYSVANTIADLSTIPQEYEPYPGADPEDPSNVLAKRSPGDYTDPSKCANCTVHAGFHRSWANTRQEIMPHVEKAIQDYPDHQLTLVGHSLGGAVAALASLEFQRKGWRPKVTTFGEPRIGNRALMDYIDARFNHSGTGPSEKGYKAGSYRRVTHADDPIPLLPLSEWGFRMHAGEIYISKTALGPKVADIQFCEGDEDPLCIASGEYPPPPRVKADDDTDPEEQQTELANGMWEIPKRYHLWQLFFAHRDYFWRLGLCVPGGDPKDWWRQYPLSDDGDLGKAEL